MKYEELDAKLKKSINGSMFFHFDSGCLDFKGGEVAFEIWAEMKIEETKDGYYYKGNRSSGLSYLDREQYEEVKERFINRYNSRMRSLYWSSQFLRS